MRHFFLPILLGFLVSLVAVWSLMTDRAVVDAPALSVNGHVLSEEDVMAFLKPGDRDRDPACTRLVQKELLVQEACRQAIHLDPAFRESVRDYYEQSLITRLIDRKFDEIDVAVPQQEIDRFRYLSGTTVDFLRLVYPSWKAFQSDTPSGERLYEGRRFSDLPTSIQYRLLNADSEGMTGTMLHDGGFARFRLTKVTSDAGDGGDSVPEDVAEAFLENEYRASILDAWITSLWAEATIRNMDTEGGEK